MEKQHKIIGKRYEIQHDINPFWIISNSTQVFQRMAKMNHEKECRHIRTYDFSNMYTSIPHKLLNISSVKRLRKHMRLPKKHLSPFTKNIHDGLNHQKTKH